MRREVLVEDGDDLFGLPFFRHGREPADVGEEHRHLAPLAAEPREIRIGDELLVDVLGDVLAEQPLHLPLLAPFEEVLIADAAEQRQRRRERRLRDVDPVAAGELPCRDERKSRDDRCECRSRPPCRQERRDQTDAERQRDDKRNAEACATRAA